MRLPLLLISSCLVWGHDLYLIPQTFHAAAGDSILVSAHTGDSFPQSEQGVDPARLSSLPALPQGSWRILGKATHATVKLEGKASQYFAAWTMPRLLSLEAVKFESYLKEEGLLKPLHLRQEKDEASKQGREMYAKFAKTYVVVGESNANFAKPLGLKIEFVPLQDPATLKPGDELALQVLYNGNALADVQVVLAFASGPTDKGQHSILGRTSKDGKITARVPAAGRLRLHCVQMERVSADTHEWESFWASFTFAVKGEATEGTGLSAGR